MKSFAPFALALSCLAALLPCAASAADAYPTRPVEIVVAYPPGGGSDMTARTIADAARPLMSIPPLVINRPGASGSIGWAYVATGAPDGYRVIIVTPEILVVPLMGIGKTTVQDFQPIARFSDDPLSLTVRADAPWKTIDEFIAYAKAHPGEVTISNAGNGTLSHIATAAMGDKLGTSFQPVPYQGTTPAVMGVLTGDVMATTIPNAELREHVKAGKMRTLAVMSEKAAPGIDGVPTFKEKGYDLQFSGWRGIALPKAAPKDVVDYWRDVARRISESPAFRTTVIKQNLTPAFADAPEFTAAIARQDDSFKKMWPGLKLDKQ
jgi:tripartite-type tricarboxylate transporter receptor subunit TctC